MQVPFSCAPDALKEIEIAIAPARLARYLPAAGHDKPYAMRLYLWNSRICESLYLPLQTAEVCVRNAIHYTLTRRYGSDWNTNHAFTNLLQNKYQKELARTTADEKEARGAAYTVDHVVSGMSFGFWVSLLTHSFRNHLWQQGLKRSFPHITQEIDREEAYTRINQLRVFRNKVAHHYAVFDQRPIDEHQNAIDIIGWCSPAAVHVVRQMTNPRDVIQKPKRWPK